MWERSEGDWDRMERLWGHGGEKRWVKLHVMETALQQKRHYEGQLSGKLEQGGGGKANGTEGHMHSVFPRVLPAPCAPERCDRSGSSSSRSFRL